MTGFSISLSSSSPAQTAGGASTGAEDESKIEEPVKIPGKQLRRSMSLEENTLEKVVIVEHYSLQDLCSVPSDLVCSSSTLDGVAYLVCDPRNASAILLPETVTMDN